MPNSAEPLIDVRYHEGFLEDEAAVDRARSFAERLSSGKPFASREEAGEAADAIRALRNAREDAEERKLEITEQWRASTAAVNTQYNELLSPVKAAEDALKAKGLAWKKAEEAKAQEAARQEAERHQKEQEERIADAQAAAELVAEEPDSLEAQSLAEQARQEAAAAASAPPPTPVAQPKQVRGSFGALSSRTVHRPEVIDAALVPVRHKAVDLTSIKREISAEAAAAKAENRAFDLEIPGVRIHSEEVGVSR